MTVCRYERNTLLRELGHERCFEVLVRAFYLGFVEILRGVWFRLGLVTGCVKVFVIFLSNFVKRRDGSE